MKDIYTLNTNYYVGMISSDLDNYNVVPVFDNETEDQVIKIHNKQKDQKLGKIKIEENDGIYHLKVIRDDLKDEVQMGVVKEQKNIGVELALVIRKLSRC